VVGEAVSLGDALVLAELLGVAVSVGVALLVGVAVSVGVALLVGVVLGVGVLVTLALPVGEGLLVGVGVGLFVTLVGVGDGLGCRGNCTHCWPVPPAVARVCTEAVPERAMLDWAADAAATERPVAVAMRTPPVTRLTPTGRTCAKRMKCPCQCCSRLLRNDLFSMEWLHPAANARLVRYAHHCTPSLVPGATMSTTP
jgi:hypothetical protein